jgi:hypothetical protein
MNPYAPADDRLLLRVRLYRSVPNQISVAVNVKSARAAIGTYARKWALSVYPDLQEVWANTLFSSLATFIFSPTISPWMLER